MSTIDTHVSAFTRSYRGDALATFTRAQASYRAVEDGISLADYATAISRARAAAENQDATDAEIGELAVTGRYSVSRGSVGHYVAAYRTTIDAGILTDKSNAAAVVAAHRVVQRGGTTAARQALVAEVAALPVEERVAAVFAGATAIARQPKSAPVKKSDPLETTDANRIDGDTGEATEVTPTAADRLAGLTAAEVVAFLTAIADRAWTVADVSLIADALDTLTETLAPAPVTIDAPAAQPMLSIAV
jgi:hypothetical protein